MGESGTGVVAPQAQLWQTAASSDWNALKLSCRSIRQSIAPPCGAAPGLPRCCCAWAKRSPACMYTARKATRTSALPAPWTIRPILRAASRQPANRAFGICRKRRRPGSSRQAPVLFRFPPAERPPSSDQPWLSVRAPSVDGAHVLVVQEMNDEICQNAAARRGSLPVSRRIRRGSAGRSSAGFRGDHRARASAVRGRAGAAGRCAGRRGAGAQNRRQHRRHRRRRAGHPHQFLRHRRGPSGDSRAGRAQSAHHGGPNRHHGRCRDQRRPCRDGGALHRRPGGDSQGFQHLAVRLRRHRRHHRCPHRPGAAWLGERAQRQAESERLGQRRRDQRRLPARWRRRRLRLASGRLLPQGGRLRNSRLRRIRRAACAGRSGGRRTRRSR